MWSFGKACFRNSRQVSSVTLSQMAFCLCVSKTIMSILAKQTLGNGTLDITIKTTMKFGTLDTASVKVTLSKIETF